MFQILVQHSDATQIVLFALVVSVLWMVEHVVLAERGADRLRHSAVNAMFVLTALPVELLLSMACLAVSHWAGAHGWGLVQMFPHPESLWVKYAFVFVALDLCDYAYHRAMHHVPALWRFHLVHHTDQSVDSSTTVREHPGESAVRGSFLILWTFILGASFEVLLLRQAAETVSAILAHSALRLPARPARILGTVFITPNLHHVHHHFVLPYTDRNFGGVFSLWDRLFGTFAELSERDTVFGLDTHMAAEETTAFPSLIAMPFVGADAALHEEIVAHRGAGFGFASPEPRP